MHTAADASLHAFLIAAAVPLEWHAGGTLDAARAMLDAEPWLGAQTIHAAAVTGNAEAVAAFLAADPSLVSAKGGPHSWDAITWCCFSRFLRDDRERRADFLRTATVLLDAGADVHSGFFDPQYREQESLVYGVAGVAFDAPLTRLLLSRGADPNDNEVPYHAAETYDLSALDALLESNTLSRDSLATLLLRKADWHDLAGVQRLLAHGVDPNHQGRWEWPPLFQAIRRDNDLAIIRALLDHGADMSREVSGHSLVLHAAARGRGDVLRLLEERGHLPALQGGGALLAACARGDRVTFDALRSADATAVESLRARGAHLLRTFAGVGNTDGLALLLALGIPVDATDAGEDGYFDVAPHSTALHVAAWRARHDTVQFLLAQGADANRRDGKGRTPLQRALAAATSSYWVSRRTTESITALLAAGADRSGIPLPTGYDEADAVLTADAH